MQFHEFFTYHVQPRVVFEGVEVANISIESR